MAEKSKKKKKQQNELFDFNEEIVIGINNKKPKSKTIKTTKQVKKVNKKTTTKAPNKKNNTEEKKSTGVFKWTILIMLLIAAIIYFMMSPLFNIEEIIVLNNNKISKDEIISLSQIERGQNTYLINKLKTRDNIKQNAYIDKVTITRRLPDKIIIEVIEREPSFMLQLGNAYIYLDSQGYMLETTQEALETPIITGLTTNTEEWKDGNRLMVEDLKKLEKVIELVTIANSQEIYDKIIKIDITDENNFILELEDEKVAHIGKINNLNVKMLYLKVILEKEEGIPGTIFLENENKEGAYFQQKI